ncbi:hypothetical protein D3C80_776780 [compost metagenome]
MKKLIMASMSISVMATVPLYSLINTFSQCVVTTTASHYPIYKPMKKLLRCMN